MKRVKEDNKMSEQCKMKLRNAKRNNDEPLANIFSNKNNFLLPPDFMDLLNAFICLDMVVNKLIGSHKNLYIEQIRNTLQQMNNGNFSSQVFGQILSVFPESYRYEFNNKQFNSSHCDTNSLRISPNLKFGYLNDSSPRKSVTSLSLSQLLLRRNTFKERLLMLVKEKHDDFLISVKKMKSDDVKNLRILRWSSDFDLQSVGPIPSIKFDENSTCFLESPFKTVGISVDSVDSGVCKDLFGRSGTEISNKAESTKKRCPRRSQAQLSFCVKNGETVVQSPNKENTDLLKQKLPFYLKALLELFINVDKSVQSLSKRGEMVYLSRVLKIVSSAKTYTESHFGQLITIYPGAYKLRWERIVNHITQRTTNKMDIVITPHLKNDGTSVSLTSPEKGFINFDCVRLTQRHQKFLQLCVTIVENGQRQYLSKNVDQAVFNADLHIDMIQASPLPTKPVSTSSDGDRKILSIADLFGTIKRHNEADLKGTATKTEIVCEKLKSLPQSLLNKVRQNKENKYLFAKNNVDLERRQIMEQLPGLVLILITESRRLGPVGGPLDKGHVMTLVSMTEGVLDEHLAVLEEVEPGLVQQLHWTPPCIQLRSGEPSIEAIKHKLATLLRGTS